MLEVRGMGCACAWAHCSCVCGHVFPYAYGGLFVHVVVLVHICVRVGGGVYMLVFEWVIECEYRHACVHDMCVSINVGCVWFCVRACVGVRVVTQLVCHMGEFESLP